MRRVLLANELGGGLGHAAILCPLASSLLRVGCEVVLVTPSSTALPLAQELPSATWMPSPVVKPSSKARRFRGPRSFAGGLIDAGFADAQYLREKLETWRALLRKVKPDLVIANHAPFLHLAARDDVTVSWVGTGFEIPPPSAALAGAGSRTPADDAQARVLACIQAAQRELRLAMAERLDAVFPAESHYIVTIPELDPHAPYRARPPDGPLATLSGGTHDGSARHRGHVFVYVAQDSPSCLPVLCGLSQGGIPAHAVIRGDGQPPWRDSFAGVKVESSLISVPDALTQSALVVHHGGLSMTQESLFAGTPQLIVPRFDEQRLNGAMLEGLGAGLSRSNPSAAMVTRIVREMLDDDSLYERCAETGQRLRAEFPSGSADSIVERCLRGIAHLPRWRVSRELPL